MDECAALDLRSMSASRAFPVHPRLVSAALRRLNPIMWRMGVKNTCVSRRRVAGRYLNRGNEKPCSLRRHASSLYAKQGQRPDLLRRQGHLRRVQLLRRVLIIRQTSRFWPSKRKAGSSLQSDRH